MSWSLQNGNMKHNWELETPGCRESAGSPQSSPELEDMGKD